MPIYSELVKPNEKRINKVFDRAIVIDLFFYLAIALLGYFSSYNYTDIIVLKRVNFIDSKDYLNLLLIICVILCILFEFPYAWNPTRY